MNSFQKLIFSLKKPQVIIVSGRDRTYTAELIFQVLSKHFKVKKGKVCSLDIFQDKILIFESEIKKIEPFEFLFKKSRLPILVATGGIPSEIQEITKLAEILSSGFLVLNFDDELVRNIKSSAENLTFGFQEKADFWATDVKVNDGTNFKINYKVNIIPVRLDKIFSKEQIYSALAVAAVGEILKLNLLKVSEGLKDCVAE